MAYELNGPSVVGTSNTLSSLLGYIIAGGITNTTTITGNGSVTVGGSSRTITIGGGGCVSIVSSGTIGVASANSVLIGGVGITISSPDVICIGASNTTMTLSPSSGKTYIKDNPVTIATSSTIGTPGTISATNLSGGYVQLTSSGAYTFDTTINIRDLILDSSGTAFVGTPVPYFVVTIQNTSGGTIIISSGTGQTFLNATSPYTIPSDATLKFTFRFTSSTTMTVETPISVLTGNGIIASSPVGNVNLSTNVMASGFRAVFTANVALGANSTITGSWSTVSPGFNIGSNFNTGSGIYTVPGTGIYIVTYQLSSSTNANTISLIVSGVVHHSTIAGGVNSNPGGSCILSLTVGDTLLLNVRTACTAYYRASNNAGRDGATFFCVARLS